MSTPSETKEWEALGKAIRERRRSLSLTLVDVAAKSELSQPFLSQIENGRAKPSLMSLHRIADALGTTPQALFIEPEVSYLQPNVVRSNTVQSVAVDGSKAESSCHLLLGGDAPLHVLEFDGLPTEYLDYFTHEGFEATYVIVGRIEVDVNGSLTELGAGDTISYPSRVPHRMRAIGRRRARVLLVATKTEPAPVVVTGRRKRLSD